MRQITQREMAEQSFIQLQAWIVKVSGGLPRDAERASHHLATVMFYAGFTPNDLHRILYGKDMSDAKEA